MLKTYLNCGKLNDMFLNVYRREQKADQTNYSCLRYAFVVRNRILKMY